MGSENSYIQFKLLNPLLNSFFAVNDPLKTNVKDIYHGLQNDCFSYALLVPDAHVLLNYYDNVSKSSYKDLCLRSEFIRDHILKLGNENQPLSKLSNLQALFNTRKPTQFYTASNKTVILRKDQIILNRLHFGNSGSYSSTEPSNINEYLSDEANLVKFRVQKTELFLNFNSFYKPDSEFLLIYINMPLTGEPISEINCHIMRSQSHLTSTYQQSQQQQQLYISKPTSVDDSATGNDLQGLNPVKTSFIDICRRFSIIEQELSDDLLFLFGSFVIDGITDIQELSTLYKETINQSALIFKSLSNEQVANIVTFDSTIDLNRCIFDYVEINLYDKIWAQMKRISKAKLVHSSITNLNNDDNCYRLAYLTPEIYEKLQDLAITQVSLFSEDEDSIFAKNGKKRKILNVLTKKIKRAAAIFSKIALSSNYFDKLNYLVRAINELTRAHTEEIHLSDTLNSDYTEININLSADMLVALLIIVVIQSKVPDIHIHLDYIKNFSYYTYIHSFPNSNSESIVDINTGFIGYCISTLEAVLYHLQNKTNLDIFIKYSQDNKKLWNYIDNDDESVEYFSEFKSFVNAQAITLKKESVLAMDNPLKTIDLNGDSALTLAIKAKNYKVLSYLLNFNEFFYPLEDILYDFDSNDFTLLHLSLKCFGDDGWHDSELYCIAKEIWDIIFYSSTIAETVTYVNQVDKLQNKNLGYYLFEILNYEYKHLINEDSLAKKISIFVNWRNKDKSAYENTPLLSLIRSYDMDNYNIFFEYIIKIVFEWYESQGEIFDFWDHVDSKQNTILHILKDNNLTPILSRGHNTIINVNQFNMKNLSPLLTYIKFNRIENLKMILDDPRLDFAKTDLKTFLTVMDYVRQGDMSNVNSKDNASNFDEFEKDTKRNFESSTVTLNIEVERIMDQHVLTKETPLINGRNIVITKGKFELNQWYFVVKGLIYESLSGDEPLELLGKTLYDSIKCNDYKAKKYSNYHSLFDLKTLIYLLHIEYPVCYLPIAYVMDSFFRMLNVSSFAYFNFNKLKLNEMIVKLNIFMTALELSREFRDHELLWEFLILPVEDTAVDSKPFSTTMEERSRAKLKAQRDKAFVNKSMDFIKTPNIEESPILESPHIPDEFTDSGFENLQELFEIDKAKNYSINEVQDILTFLTYTLGELELLSNVLRKLIQLMIVKKHKQDDLILGYKNFAKLVEGTPSSLMYANGLGNRQPGEKISHTKNTGVNTEKELLKNLPRLFAKIYNESPINCCNSGYEVHRSKFIFEIQFLYNCVIRLIKNIRSIINKKIHKWIKMYEEIDRLKSELKKLRPEEFSRQSSFRGDISDNNISNSNLFSSKQNISEIRHGGSHHGRSDSVSSISTIQGSDEDMLLLTPKLRELEQFDNGFSNGKEDEPPVNIFSDDVDDLPDSITDNQAKMVSSMASRRGLKGPPLIVINNGGSNNFGVEPVAGTELKTPNVARSFIVSPLQAKTEIGPTFPKFLATSSVPSSAGSDVVTSRDTIESMGFMQADNDNNSVQSLLSSSGVGVSGQTNQPVTPRRRKFLFSSILENRKTNYESKILTKYKVNRLKLIALTNDVKFDNESIATELNNFMDFKKSFLKNAMRQYAKDEIRNLKYKLSCIKLEKSNF